MVNVQKAGRQLSLIKENLLFLQQKAHELTLEKLAVDKTQLYSVLHGLQLCIESMINVSNHILADAGHVIPDENRAIFQALAKTGIIPPSRVPNYTAMVRFRNRIVHLYWQTDPQEIWDILLHHLGDMENFLEEIGEYLSKQTTDK